MKYIASLLLLTAVSNYSLSQTNLTPAESWCSHPPRPAFNKLTEIQTTSHWFKVYSIARGVLAIVEPYNFEEVISYLIIGEKKALLFDTGMGLDSISPVIAQLTQLPVTVINSHTHFDHTGGNYEFKNILALQTPFTKHHAKQGWPHDAVKQEVTPAALCWQYLPGADTANYSIKPFAVSRFVQEGDEIDLGGIKLYIMRAPGHTPDAIALLDKQNGFLWTGDTFYEGPIYLFNEETDLHAYEKSIAKLAGLVPVLKKVFPSHNNPVCIPERLTSLVHDFAAVKNGKATGTDNGENALLFQFDSFGFLIGKDILKKFRGQ